MRIGDRACCWLRWFTTSNTTHHQHPLVKRCASANKPCMVGGWVQVGGCELVGERVAGCVPLSSKDNASRSSDILAAACQATAAAVFIPGSTSTHAKRHCKFRREDVPCLGLICTGGSVRGTNQARTSCCRRRQDGNECRLYTHNVTKALIRHLHKASYYIIPGTPEAICQKCIVRT